MSINYHRLKISQLKKTIYGSFLEHTCDLPSLRNIPFTVFTPKVLGSPWDLQVGEQQAVAEDSPFASVTSFPESMHSLPSSLPSLSRNFSWMFFKILGGEILWNSHGYPTMFKVEKLKFREASVLSNPLLWEVPDLLVWPKWVWSQRPVLPTAPDCFLNHQLWGREEVLLQWS